MRKIRGASVKEVGDVSQAAPLSPEASVRPHPCSGRSAFREQAEDRFDDREPRDSRAFPRNAQTRRGTAYRARRTATFRRSVSRPSVAGGRLGRPGSSQRRTVRHGEERSPWRQRRFPCSSPGRGVQGAAALQRPVNGGALIAEGRLCRPEGSLQSSTAGREEGGLRRKQSFPPTSSPCRKVRVPQRSIGRSVMQR